MSEVDGILLTQLRNLNIEGVASVTTVADLKGAPFYEAVYRCLEHLNPEAAGSLVPALPKGRGKKFQACTDVAGVLQGQGYPKDVTFNQFMYNEVGDMRSILNWLCQEMQKGSSNAGARVEHTRVAGGRGGFAANAWEALADVARATSAAVVQRRKESSVVYPPPKGAYSEAAAAAAAAAAAVEELRPFLAPATDEEEEWVVQNVQPCVRQVSAASAARSKAALFSSLNEYNLSQYGKERAVEREIEATGATKKEVKQRKKELRAQLFAAAAEGTTGASVSASAVLAKLYGASESSSLAVAAAAAAAALEGGSKTSKFLSEQHFNSETTVLLGEHGTAAGEAKKEAKVELTEEQKAQLKSNEEELIMKRKAEERAELKKQVKKASDSLKAAMAEQDELEAELVVLAAARKADAARAKESVKEGDHLEEMYAVFEKALELCDSDEAKEALHARLEEAEGAYAQLQEEWTAKEAKMKGKYEAAVAEYEKAIEHTQELTEALATLKGELKELRTEVKKKGELRDQLVAQRDKLGLPEVAAAAPAETEEGAGGKENPGRPYYSGRIALLNRNLMKEENEVTKISAEAREMMSECAALEAGLDRAFAATEQTCFTETKKMESSSMGLGVAVYQEIIALRESFARLIASVEEQAQVRQQIHESSEKAEKQKMRNEGLNTEEVQADLSELQAENVGLAAEVKELRSQLKQLV